MARRSGGRGTSARLAGTVAMVLVLGACGSGGKARPIAAPAPTTGLAPTTVAPTTTAPPAPVTTTTEPAPLLSTLATAKPAIHSVDIYASPVQPEPARELDNPQPSGAAPGSTFPLRMLVVEDRGDWLKVLLPIRPNGSSGWVQRSAVDLQTNDFRALVELGEHRITVWKGNEVFMEESVGVGASGRTPTTQGLFFTTELYVVTPSQQAAYGPYAFALSGFSEVHYSFGDGGTGVLGLHGTSDTSSLGRDVSNGCIRMSNSGITKLAKAMPLGTPVEVRA